LPFDNLSGDPEQEYFSDGITDSIILNLSMFPGLHVKSRNSSFAFKQQIKSLGEISRELEVDYIVEGSIRKSQDRIRITVQLIEAANGNQVWGKRYDAGIDNLFDLEEDLSRSIAATVTGQIESDLQRIAVAKGAAGQESYDLLLSGVYHAIRFNRQDTLIGIEKLNQCLAQDPDNVRAHVYLYSCHSMSYLERWTEDYLASFTKAAEHIKRST
jgi:TolB-like protein